MKNGKTEYFFSISLVFLLFFLLYFGEVEKQNVNRTTLILLVVVAVATAAAVVHDWRDAFRRHGYGNGSSDNEHDADWPAATRKSIIIILIIIIAIIMSLYRKFSESDSFRKTGFYIYVVWHGMAWHGIAWWCVVWARRPHVQNVALCENI